jgi:hypothetical protein
VGIAARRVVVGALAVAAALTLTGCGELGVANPRLKSFAPGAANAWPDPEPSATATETPPAAAPEGAAPCPAGPYQLEVEQALASTGHYGRVTVDGQQSAEDCATIIAFQTRMGIEPANGTPGPTTKDVAQRLAATDPSQCPVADVPIACVDLTNQTFYIVAKGTVIHGPTVTRTGMPGWATPSGAFRINRRNAMEWSVPFEVWLPNFQHFYLGMGLHTTTTYIHNMPLGSHGCVNLLPYDSNTAWRLLTVGSTIYLYGRRPGT